MIKNIIFVILGSFFIYTSHYFMEDALGEKRDGGADPNAMIGESPELVVATKLLGGFRGILIDILWIRAINLEAEAKYFEIAQLFDLICKLEPRIPSVWSYASWNLAYNVSKEVPELDQKWEWVKAGINLLRNKGLEYCPKEYRIYEDLANIYFHKIGGTTDESHDYYKEMLAAEMDAIFGDNFNVIDYLNVLTVAEINESKIGSDLFKKLKDDGFRKLLFRVLSNQVKPTKEIEEFLSLNKDEKIFQEVIKYYRCQMIKTELRMDILMIKAVEDKYGKLEWRSGVCHGLYWVFAGFVNAADKKLTTERLETYILKDIFFFGSVYPIYDKNGNKHYNFGPDFSKAEILHKRYLDYLNIYPFDNVTMTFYYAYRSFLETIVIEMVMRGDKQTAERFYNEGKGPLKELNMPATAQEFADAAFKKVINDKTNQEHIMMIFSPIERYYKDRFILGETVTSESVYANFIVKNYREWVAKKGTNKNPIPSLKEIQMMVLSNMIKRYEGLSQNYIDLMKEEFEKLKSEVENTRKETR